MKEKNDRPLFCSSFFWLPLLSEGIFNFLCSMLFSLILFYFACQRNQQRIERLLLHPGFGGTSFLGSSESVGC
jgi:hypothetical protein